MPLINIVYPHTRRNGHAEYKGDFTVILSTYPVDDCDMYVYQDAFSYIGERPGVEVLLMLEPYVVLPGEYSDDVWHYFDYVLTFVDGLAEREGKFRKINFPVFPVYDDRGTGDLVDINITIPLNERKNAICLINGNKSSPVEGELYSKRIEISKWFYSNSDIPFDVYGYPPFELPNYYGKVAHKFKTLAQYKYLLCFENVYHPIWSRGYISEKLLHSMVIGTVPIYLGCYNIEDYVPTDCFIDFRQFDNYADLDRFLHGLSDKEYQAYVDNIRAWVKAGNLDAYSVHRLYDKLANLLEPGWAEALHDQTWKHGVSKQYRGTRRGMTPGKPVWSWHNLANANKAHTSARTMIEKNPKCEPQKMAAKESCWLLNYRKNLTSQHGEDGILDKIFQIIGEQSRWCVEFGAWDGKHLSNTWALINQKGWSAVLIEGDEARATNLKLHYGSNPKVRCLQAWISDSMPLDYVLSKTEIPEQFDLLSIDIDGDDYWVWKACTRYRARVVVIETNPTFGSDIYFVPRTGNDIGASMKAMVALGRSKGYQLVAYTNINCIFVTAEEYPKFGIVDNSCEAMFRSPFVPRIVSDLDGNHYLLKTGPWGLNKIMGIGDIVHIAERGPF